ncbi:MAG: hypothetical protein JWP97_2761 [Labilithrix sp.]|nr:hypothetical protein [Labilithrix sp.]
MCCFSRSVEGVSSTRIFARPLEGDRQLIVYGMTVGLTEDTAMILPVPVPPGSAEDAVRFVDLSGCPRFFEELGTMFVRPRSAVAIDTERPATAGLLAVHEVGDFEASFVPSPSHFNRLDPRFRLPLDVWDAIPGYHDHGFCVFKLRTRSRPSGFFGRFKTKVPAEVHAVHPMAFEFPRRDASVLFYPTVHVHDGMVHPVADFDHTLYCQVDRAWEPLMEWERSAMRGAELASEAAREHLDGGAFVWKRELRGELPNRDTTLNETRLSARTAVAEHFRVRMCAAWEHLVDDGKTELAPHVKKWMRVGEAERVRIREVVRAEIQPLLERRAGEWGIGRFAHERPWVCVRASNDRIEPQELHLTFEADPHEAALAELTSAFQVALDRATASSVPPSRLPPSMPPG